MKRYYNHIAIKYVLFVLFSFMTFIIYYSMTYIVLEEQRTSISHHMRYAELRAIGEPIRLNFETLPHIGYLDILQSLNDMGIPFNWATILVLSLSGLLTFWITYFFFRSEISSNFDQRLILIIAFASMWIGAIHLPFPEYRIYFGQGSPNVLHNSTLITMKPFMLLGFIYFMKTLRSPAYRKDILATIFISISTYIKPSFGLVFFPIIGLYIIYRRENFKRNIISMILLVLPTLLILMSQFSEYYGNSGSRSIGISFLEMWQSLTPSIPMSIIVVLAFPILMLAYRPKTNDIRKYIYIAWLVTLLGMAQFIILIELGSNGKPIYSGNWINGYLNGMMILFPAVLIEYLFFLNEYYKRVTTQPILFWLCTVALGLHLHGGIHYILQYLFNV